MGLVDALDVLSGWTQNPTALWQIARQVIIQTRRL